MGRRSLLAFVVLVLVGIGMLAALRRAPAPPADPSTPTPTIREDTRRTQQLPRGRIRVAQLQPGELRLEGLVVDDKEQPVGGAKVVLGHARETATEADGSFAFDHLAAGDYQVSAETGDSYAQSDLALTATSDPTTLKLRRGAQLIVHVVDAVTRAPIADATVKTNDRSGVTDDTGTVALRAIDDGYERFEVHAVGRAPFRSWVISDGPTRLERTVPIGRAAPISGIVVDADGRPVGNARVRLEAAGSVWSENVEADAAGTWTIATFGAGRHAAHASSDIHAAMPDVSFESDGIHPTTGVVVRVQLGARITGIVVDPNGRPLADIRVRGGTTGAATGADGRFVLEGLAEGEYTVSAESMTGTAAVPVKLASGGRAEVRLVFHEASVAGVAVDAQGKPYANAAIAITSKTGTTHTTSSNDHGTFDFGGVEPGEYTIRARHHDVMDYGERIGPTVRAGDRAVRVVVDELATLRGRVVFDGKPVHEYGVVITTRVAPRYGSPTIVRAADGRFTQRDVAGTVVVTIVGADFASRSIPNVDIVPGRTTDLGDIAVERGRVIAGRVVDPRGVPVAGAHVSVMRGTSSYDADDVTWRRRLQESFARTDAAGRYTIAGIPEKMPLRIEATHDRGIAPSRPLGDANTVDLVLAETGALHGTIGRFDGNQFHAIAVSVADPALRLTADLDRAGGFTFARLPAGDYLVRISGTNTLSAQRVTIGGGARATIAFELPEAPIRLTVRAADCTHVIVHDLISGDALESKDCTAGAGEIERVSPGRYRVCLDLSDDCSMIDVAPSPRRQTVVIAR